MSLTQTRNHASPATLGGLGFQIESRDDRTITVQATGGHLLTSAGMIAVLGVANTYLSGLSAANQSALVGPQREIRLAPGYATFPVQNADVVTVANNLITTITTAGNTTRG